MTLAACKQRAEVRRMLTIGHYPQAATAELRAHVAACAGCADLVLVTQAFQAARAGATAQASLPAPGALWWRAQLRMRNAAIRKVTQPFVGAQVFACLVALAAAVGLVAWQARDGALSGARYFEAIFPASLPWSGWEMALVGGLAAAALVSAVAIYIALEKQ